MVWYKRAGVWASNLDLTPLFPAFPVTPLFGLSTVCVDNLMKTCPMWLMHKGLSLVARHRSISCLSWQVGTLIARQDAALAARVSGISRLSAPLRSYIPRSRAVGLPVPRLRVVRGPKSPACTARSAWPTPLLGRGGTLILCRADRVDPVGAVAGDAISHQLRELLQAVGRVAQLFGVQGQGVEALMGVEAQPLERQWKLSDQ